MDHEDSALLDELVVTSAEKLVTSQEELIVTSAEELATGCHAVMGHEDSVHVEILVTKERLILEVQNLTFQSEKWTRLYIFYVVKVNSEHYKGCARIPNMLLRKW